MTKRSECKSKRRHLNDMLLLMNRSSSAELPNPISVDTIPLLCSKKLITMKGFPVNRSVRTKLNNGLRSKFACTGYIAFPIQFGADATSVLETMIAAVVRDNVNSMRTSTLTYRGGRLGHLFSSAHLRMYGRDLCRLLFDQGAADSVHHYMASEQPPKIFSIEVLEVDKGAPKQDKHADVRDLDNKVHTERLAVTAIFSTGDPITTVVYPNTRSDKTWKRSHESSAPGIRATEHYNFIAFDACLAHHGESNNSGQSIFWICITFIQESASAEQLQFVERRLARRSLDLSIEYLRNGMGR